MSVPIRAKRSSEKITAINEAPLNIGPNIIIVFKDLNRGLIMLCVTTTETDQTPKQMLT